MRTVRLDRIKLYVIMKSRDLLLKDVCERSSVSRATLSYILAGKSCTPETAQKIANALEMKVEDLIEG